MKKIIILHFLLLILLSCSQNNELGSKNNPVKMYFVPWTEAGKIINDSQPLKAYLEKETGYHFKIGVPISYAAVIEAIGTEEVDVAWLPPFAYVLANEKFGAQVVLIPVRQGIKKYRGCFITRKDSGIDSLSDIEGRPIAYTDAASTSGYIFPSAKLAQMGITPGEIYFAGGHTAAIIAVYQGRVDVGCAYWSPPKEDGTPRDGRKEILETYPDIFEKTKIIGFTDWIMNDTVTMRKGIAANLYDIDSYVKGNDSDYDSIRNALKALGKNAEEYIE